MSNNIEGKVVVTTEASSGLGDATGWLLSAQGASIVLGARRVDRIQSLADEVTGSGGKALAVATDVTQCDQVKRFVDAAVQTYRRIDVMINNAGQYGGANHYALQLGDAPVPPALNAAGKLKKVALGSRTRISCLPSSTEWQDTTHFSIVITKA